MQYTANRVGALHGPAASHIRQISKVTEQAKYDALRAYFCQRTKLVEANLEEACP